MLTDSSRENHRIELNDASDLSRTGSLAFGVDCDMRQQRTGFIGEKPASAISGHPDIPCFLLLDNPVNELFLLFGWEPIAF
jgi:hypothetical protein